MDYNNFYEFVQWCEKLTKTDSLLTKNQQITTILADIATNYSKSEICNKDVHECEIEDRLIIFKIWSLFVLNMPIVHQTKHITEKSLQTIQSKIETLYPNHSNCSIKSLEQYIDILMVFKLIYNLNNTKIQSMKIATIIDIESLIGCINNNTVLKYLILGKINTGISYIKYIMYLQIQEQYDEQAKLVLNLLINQSK